MGDEIINKQWGVYDRTAIMWAVISGNIAAVKVLGRIPRVQWSKEELISEARESSSMKPVEMNSMLALLEELDQERKKTKEVKNDAVVRAETEKKRKEEETRRQREEKRREEEQGREEEQVRQAEI